jgi:hypothetical protein
MRVHQRQLGGDLVLAIGIEHGDPMEDRGSRPGSDGPAGTPTSACPRCSVDLRVAADPPVVRAATRRSTMPRDPSVRPDVVDRVV